MRTASTAAIARIIILCLVASIGLAVQTTAQSVYVSDIGSDNGMLRIRPAKDAHSQPTLGVKSPAGDLPFRVGFHVENVSGEAISDALVTAYAFSEDGQARGFYTFTSKLRLPAGESAYHLHKTDSFTLNPTDTVLLVVEEIMGSDRTWKIDEGSLDGIGPDSILPYDHFGDSMELKAGDPCIAFCDAREERCNTTCSQGVQEFSCSCGSDGTRSSSCKCVIRTN